MKSVSLICASLSAIEPVDELHKTTESRRNGTTSKKHLAALDLFKVRNHTRHCADLRIEAEVRNGWGEEDEQLLITKILCIGPE